MMALLTLRLLSVLACIYAVDTCYNPLTQECGGRLLNDTEFCCNNQTYSKNSKQCCCIDKIAGLEVVHTEERICCGGQVFNKTDSFGEQRDCCGDKIYTISDQNMCCRPHERYARFRRNKAKLHHYDPDLYPNWENSSCCGTEILIDKNKQICCEDTINSISGSPSDWFCCNKTSFNQRSHECKKHDPNNHIIMLHFHDICNGSVFDTRQNTCCNNILHPYHNKEQFECCGSQIRNIETQQCCNKTLSLVISKSRTCCGSRPTGIDGSEQRCCYLNSSTYVYNITTQDDNCCGNGLYNKHLEFCCQGKPYLLQDFKRCGTSKECVVVNHQDDCCGVHQLHRHNTTCCDNHLLVAKKSSSQDKCCYNWYNKSGESYMSETQECIRGKIEVKAKRCRYEKYNNNSDLCCNNNLYRGAKDKSNNSCCDSRVYNRNTQRCCSFKVINATKCPEPDTICRNLCAKNRREVAEKIENGVFDSAICMLKLAYVGVVRRETVDFDVQTMKYVIRRPSRNIFTNRFEIHHKYLLLPWICKKNFSRIIAITSNREDKTRELSCFERDIVLPYSKRIKQAVKDRRKYCGPVLTNTNMK